MELTVLNKQSGVCRQTASFEDTDLYTNAVSLRTIDVQILNNLAVSKSKAVHFDLLNLTKGPADRWLQQWHNSPTHSIVFKLHFTFEDTRLNNCFSSQNAHSQSQQSQMKYL